MLVSALAVVAELQKLGLELPPQINCFVQSMARLSNTLSEMNTIINQTSELLDAADGYIRQGPAPQRDELDLLGMALDFRNTPEGKAPVADDQSVVGLAKDGKNIPISAFCHRLTDSVGFGGFSLEDGETFQDGGDYHTRVMNRVLNAAEPVAEARKLADMFKMHADAEHNENSQVYVELVDEAIAKLDTDLAAADTQEKKNAAVKAFATTYGKSLQKVMEGIQTIEGGLVYMRTFESVEAPSSFANAVMTTIMDNFDALSDTFEDSRTRLIADVFSITSNELKTGWFAGEATRVQAVKDDALKMAGDNSYQIDIGV